MIISDIYCYGLVDNLDENHYICTLNSINVISLLNYY